MGPELVPQVTGCTGGTELRASNRSRTRGLASEQNNDSKGKSPSGSGWQLPRIHQKMRGDIKRGSALSANHQDFPTFLGPAIDQVLRRRISELVHNNSSQTPQHVFPSAKFAFSMLAGLIHVHATMDMALSRYGGSRRVDMLVVSQCS